MKESLKPPSIFCLAVGDAFSMLSVKEKRYAHYMARYELDYPLLVYN